VVVTSASVDQYWRLVLNATLMLLVRAGLVGRIGGQNRNIGVHPILSAIHHGGHAVSGELAA
jgi:hypothetical protein